MSFLEAVRFGLNASAGTMTHEKESKEASQLTHARCRLPERKPTTPEQESSDSVDEMSETFDSDFMMDGTKGMRGGKDRFMYNCQPKKKYRQWRSKNQLGTMLSCGARVPENNMISDRQGNRIMVKA
jgi:hypothetical protein